ncbi:MAG: cytochrome c [Desulfobacteraceae bacterium]|jgi:cytochrome c2|nr:cytochrome c [Desulfobacteraceae bacterium]MDH3568337.1 cytochrome c [Desulfobacteraceae bacterium]
MKHAIFTVLSIFIAALYACSGIQEGKTLFESKCAQCHKLEQSLKETRNLAEWTKITQRMAGYSDGGITGKEAEKIAEYLAKK